MKFFLLSIISIYMTAAMHVDKIEEDNLSYIKNLMLAGADDIDLDVNEWLNIYKDLDQDVDCTYHLDPLEQEEYICSKVANKWYSSWFSWCPQPQKNLEIAESDLLNYLKTNYTGSYVDIGCITNGPTSYIWTVSANRDSTKVPIVLIHGYAAGLGLWMLNFDDLAKDHPVYMIDILGFGRSSRTHLSKDPIETEKEFLLSLENWRKQVGILKMVLVGHSFGGFLSASYAIKYPERIAHLVLADPWGFDERPTDVQKKYQVPTWLKMVSKAIQPINPLGILRSAGRLGPTLLSKIRPDLANKFSDVVDTETMVIPNYLYQCNIQEPTGEEAFKSMMAGYGWAKYPMSLRLPSLPSQVPTTFIYGNQSWVDTKPAFQVKNARQSSYVNIQIIENSSHHVYADQYKTFNMIVNTIANSYDQGLLPPYTLVRDGL